MPPVSITRHTFSAGLHLRTRSFQAEGNNSGVSKQQRHRKEKKRNIHIRSLHQQWIGRVRKDYRGDNEGRGYMNDGDYTAYSSVHCTFKVGV